MALLIAAAQQRPAPLRRHLHKPEHRPSQQIILHVKKCSVDVFQVGQHWSLAKQSTPRQHSADPNSARTIRQSERRAWRCFEAWPISPDREGNGGWVMRRAHRLQWVLSGGCFCLARARTPHTREFPTGFASASAIARLSPLLHTHQPHSSTDGHTDKSVYCLAPGSPISSTRACIPAMTDNSTDYT